MLLRVGNKVFNTEQLSAAEFFPADKGLRLHFAEKVSLWFEGEAADRLWARLIKDAEFVAEETKKEDSEQDDAPPSASFQWG